MKDENETPTRRTRGTRAKTKVTPSMIETLSEKISTLELALAALSIKLDNLLQERAVNNSHFYELIKVMKSFDSNISGVKKSVDDMGNDVLDLLEAAERRPVSPSPVGPAHPVSVSPVGHAGGKPVSLGLPVQSSHSLPAGQDDLGLKTTGSQAPRRPQPQVHVPRVPVQSKPGSMEFLGEQGAFGDAMAFQDNH